MIHQFCARASSSITDIRAGGYILEPPASKTHSD
jgi:hypothetical protein